MFRSTVRFGTLVFVLAAVVGKTADAATITAASCSGPDVQSAIARAGNGDTVVIPAGICTWTTPLAISQAITVTGSGVCGGYVGESTSTVAVGTGNKSFSTRAGLGFVGGQTITARYINREGAHSMTGTVSSYDGATVTLNVQSVTGSGTWGSWVFERAGSTNIVNSAVSTQFQPMMSVTESDAGSVNIGCITFKNGSGANGAHIVIRPATNGYPVLIHDSWFQMDKGLMHGIYLTFNRGVFARNSYVGRLCSFRSVCAEGTNSGVVVGNESLTDSWSTPSTMGMADSSGRGNIYLEDSYFLGFMQSAAGTDSGGRMVLRRSIMNHAVIGTHGADTANLGMRHIEIYDNQFLFHNLGDVDTWNLNYWIFLRGGTMVATGNNMNDIRSSMWGDKPEITMTILNLQRNSGPNPCWGVNTPGAQLHVPRQVGFGYVTGRGVDGLGRSRDWVAYVGDSEPVYIWNNAGNPQSVVQDDLTRNCGTSASYDSTSAYIVQGRDYFLTAKPNYSPYSYPHPLAGSGSGPGNLTAPAAATNVRIVR